jgi:hypothetical protein
MMTSFMTRDTESVRMRQMMTSFTRVGLALTRARCGGWAGGRQNNAITGALPAFSSTLQSLQEFSAAGNQLHGTLPAGLGHVSTLKAFDVSDNR